MFFQTIQTMIFIIFFVNVRMVGMTNSTWILIVTIEGIEQNQMQDMKKTGFSSHKNNIFYHASLKTCFLKNKRR